MNQEQQMMLEKHKLHNFFVIAFSAAILFLPAGLVLFIIHFKKTKAFKEKWGIE